MTDRIDNHPWLDSVPREWPVGRLKTTVAFMQNGLWGEEPDGINDIVCIRVADFDRVQHRILLDQPTIRSVPLSKIGRRLLKKGDLLIEKSGGGEHQPVGAVMKYDHGVRAVCSNFIARIEAKATFDSGFLCYLHAALYGLRIPHRSIKQTTGIQNLDAESYFNELVPLPPCELQRRIACFLDRETAAIDVLIAKKERLIELLQDKRQALITQAVTKGLDPTVPMKESGYPLLGNVPAAWEVVGVKHIITFITSGSRGWSEYFADHGALFLQSGNLDRRLGLNLDGAQHVRPPRGAEGRRTGIQVGDILVCITGALTGNVSVVRANIGEAYVNQHVALVRADKRRISPVFLALLLSSTAGANQFLAAQYGGTKQGLGLQDVRDVRFALPPREDQDQIVALVEAFMRRHEVLCQRVRTQVGRLREYRQALITAAVTGKIDVSTEAA